MLPRLHSWCYSQPEGLKNTHTHKHTVLACSPHIYTYVHKRTQVGQRSVVCQFVVPLVPSQEAHRQASSHAKTGTSPANTHINLRGYYTVAAGTAVSGFCMCVCPCVYLCLCVCLPLLLSIFIHRKSQMLKNWEHVKDTAALFTHMEDATDLLQITARGCGSHLSLSLKIKKLFFFFFFFFCTQWRQYQRAADWKSVLILSHPALCTNKKVNAN